MFKEKIFQVALLLSVIIHGAILFQNPNLHFFNTDKKEQKTELSYVKQPRDTGPALKALIRDEPFLKLDQKIVADNRMPPPSINKEEIFKKALALPPKQADFAKPTLVSPDVVSLKKKITLPPIDVDKINNPSYISYYQIVREKIKRAAYQNYTRQNTGEVYLSFIVSNDGFLKDARLVEEKSSSDQYLKEIAQRSLKDASPFPNFPKDLNYPSLSFNVVISFEIE